MSLYPNMKYWNMPQASPYWVWINVKSRIPGVSWYYLTYQIKEWSTLMDARVLHWDAILQKWNWHTEDKTVWCPIPSPEEEYFYAG
jgi:hypothetical protein